MGRTYGYDETGSYTAFFIMAPLALYLVPATISRLRSSASTSAAKPSTTVECLGISMSG
jgi:preprotein translocase subunit Sec63